MTNPEPAPTRDSNGGNGWTSLKGWSQAIGLVGIPGAIALFLVYDGATRRAELERQFQAIVIRQEQVIKNQEILFNKMERLTRFIACSNTARDNETRARCFEQ